MFRVDVGRVAVVHQTVIVPVDPVVCTEVAAVVVVVVAVEQLLLEVEVAVVAAVAWVALLLGLIVHFVHEFVVAVMTHMVAKEVACRDHRAEAPGYTVAVLVVEVPAAVEALHFHLKVVQL